MFECSIFFSVCHCMAPTNSGVPLRWNPEKIYNALMEILLLLPILAPYTQPPTSPWKKSGYATDIKSTPMHLPHVLLHKQYDKFLVDEAKRDYCSQNLSVLCLPCLSHSSEWWTEVISPFSAHCHIMSLVQYL